MDSWRNCLKFSRVIDSSSIVLPPQSAFYPRDHLLIRHCLRFEILIFLENYFPFESFNRFWINFNLLHNQMLLPPILHRKCDKRPEYPISDYLHPLSSAPIDQTPNPCKLILDKRQIPLCLFFCQRSDRVKWSWQSNEVIYLCVRLIGSFSKHSPPPLNILF